MAQLRLGFDIPLTKICFKNRPQRRRYVNLSGMSPAVDVMITIFCDFPQFFSKIGVFFQKPML
jgi:hypothetical protein